MKNYLIKLKRLNIVGSFYFKKWNIDNIKCICININCLVLIVFRVFFINETQFLPGSGHIDTAYMGCTTWDANKTAGEETRMATTQECCVQSWTSPGSNTPQDTNCTATCPLSRKTIQVRRTRHAGHCWRSRDELIRDVLLWIPTHGRAKAGRPARTYIQQLCEDTGCCPEDLPRAMNDREEWRERVRDIRAASTIWWMMMMI